MGRTKNTPQKIVYDSEKEWDVEHIVSKRFTKQNKIEYQVKWKDYPSTDNTWEPAENLGCHVLIINFEKELKQKEEEEAATKKSKAVVVNDKVIKEEPADIIDVPMTSSSTASTSVPKPAEGRKDEEENEKDDDKNEDADEEEGEGSNEWEVAEIVDKKIYRGKVSYFVRWKDFSDDDNTWEPLSNLTTCPELIEQFEAKLKDDKVKPTSKADMGKSTPKAESPKKVLSERKKGRKVAAPIKVKWKVPTEGSTPSSPTKVSEKGDNSPAPKTRKSLARGREEVVPVEKKKEDKAKAPKEAEEKEQERPRRESRRSAVKKTVEKPKPAEEKPAGRRSTARGETIAAVEKPKGKPAAVEKPKGKPAVVEKPKGKPAVVEKPKGKPAVVEKPKGKPAVVEKPKGKPAAVEKPKEKPAAVEEVKEKAQEQEEKPKAKIIKATEPKKSATEISSSLMASVKFTPIEEQKFTAEEVEKIIDKKIVRGKPRYFVVWKEEQEKANAWILKELLECPELIAAYEQKLSSSSRPARKPKPNMMYEEFATDLPRFTTASRGAKSIEKTSTASEKKDASSTVLGGKRKAEEKNDENEAQSSSKKRKVDEQAQKVLAVVAEKEAAEKVEKEKAEKAAAVKEAAKKAAERASKEKAAKAEKAANEKAEKEAAAKAAREAAMKAAKDAAAKKKREETELERVLAAARKRSKELAEKKKRQELEAQRKLEAEKKKKITIEHIQELAAAKKRARELASAEAAAKKKKEQEEEAMETDALPSDVKPDKESKGSQSTEKKNTEDNVDEEDKKNKEAEHVDIPVPDVGEDMFTDALETGESKTESVKKSVDDEQFISSIIDHNINKLTKKKKTQLSPSKQSASAKKSALAAAAAAVDSVNWNKGTKVEKVCNATKLNKGIIQLRVKYVGLQDMEYIPSILVNEKFPQEVIQFYQRQIKLEKQPQ